MSGAYDDILNLPHHVSSKRKRMSMLDRAAQFSPFAALTGYDAAIQETGRLTQWQMELDTDEKNVLNSKLQLLHQIEKNQPEVTISYFIPDSRKSGGAYVSVTGKVRKIDPVYKCVFLTDGISVDFNRICNIQGDAFHSYDTDSL